MSWISNVSIVASLILAIFGIGGYIYGISSYLMRKAHTGTQQNSASSTSSTPKALKSSIPYKPLSCMEWLEVFAQGLVDTSNFVFSLLPKDMSLEKETIATQVGGCFLVCGMGALIAEFFLGLIFGGFLYILGVGNAGSIAIAIDTILLFMLFSLLYIYHVGRRVEMKQLVLGDTVHLRENKQ